ncbi:MAG: hypothetical protein ACYTGC_01585 [Planctomycetota bacterium]|jgi:hypothetical protein
MPDDRASTIAHVAHLRCAVERRAALDAFVSTLAESDLGTRAWDLATPWLPAEALAGRRPPPVSFVILEPDARRYRARALSDGRHVFSASALVAVEQLRKRFGHAEQDRSGTRSQSERRGVTCTR